MFVHSMYCLVLFGAVWSTLNALKCFELDFYLVFPLIISQSMANVILILGWLYFRNRLFYACLSIPYFMIPDESIRLIEKNRAVFVRFQ